MILIDLKLALFVFLIVTIGGVVGFAIALRSTLSRSSILHRAVAQVQSELPVGLVIVAQDGAILQTNTIAQQMHRNLDHEARGTDSSIATILPEICGMTHAANGIISHPLSVRWWHYPLDRQRALLVLIDTRDYQHLIQRHKAFIGQLSHELRTPLTSLIAHLDVARTPQASAALRDASLDTLSRETHRLARLVQDLLALHRLETASDVSLRPTNVALVAEEAITQLFPTAEEQGISIVLDADNGLPLARAEPAWLTQVFLNVLDNALKYSRHGDRVTIRLRVLTTGVHCVVADTGPGISSTHLPHVREPLYRGRTDVVGSGLGLAIVDAILQQHRTILDLQSSTAPDESGTVCSWVLPYA